MQPLRLDASVDRVDELCEAAHELARRARAEKWPAALREATAALATDLELLAGALDCSEGAEQINVVIDEARDVLPRCFADFAIALVNDIIRDLRAAAYGAASAAGEAAPRTGLPRGRRARASGGF